MQKFGTVRPRKAGVHDPNTVALTLPAGSSSLASYTTLSLRTAAAGGTLLPSCARGIVDAGRLTLSRQSWQSKGLFGIGGLRAGQPGRCLG